MVNYSDIRSKRLAKNWSQNKLAIKSGVSRVTITHIENGKANPTIETLNMIYKALF